MGGGVEERCQDTVTTGEISSRSYLRIYCRAYKMLTEKNLKLHHKEAILLTGLQLLFWIYRQVLNYPPAPPIALLEWIESQQRILEGLALVHRYQAISRHQRPALDSGLRLLTDETH